MSKFGRIMISGIITSAILMTACGKETNNKKLDLTPVNGSVEEEVEIIYPEEETVVEVEENKLPIPNEELEAMSFKEMIDFFAQDKEHADLWFSLTSEQKKIINEKNDEMAAMTLEELDFLTQDEDHITIFCNLLPEQQEVLDAKYAERKAYDEAIEEAKANVKNNYTKETLTEAYFDAFKEAFGCQIVDDDTYQNYIEQEKGFTVEAYGMTITADWEKIPEAPSFQRSTELSSSWNDLCEQFKNSEIYPYTEKISITPTWTDHNQAIVNERYFTYPEPNTLYEDGTIWLDSNNIDLIDIDAVIEQDKEFMLHGWEIINSHYEGDGGPEDEDAYFTYHDNFPVIFSFGYTDPVTKEKAFFESGDLGNVMVYISMFEGGVTIFSPHIMTEEMFDDKAMELAEEMASVYFVD